VIPPVTHLGAVVLQARVAAVVGNQIRLHYKGQSTEDDEWLPVGSKELQERIVTISPPKPHAKTAVASNPAS
jgi:hypothetical protein